MRYSNNRSGSRVATSSYSTRRVTRGDGVKRVKYTFDPFNEYDFLNDEDHYELYGRRRRRQQLGSYSQRISTREHLRRGSRCLVRHNESFNHEEMDQNPNFLSSRRTRISRGDHKAASTSESEDRTADSNNRSRNNNSKSDHEETSDANEDEQESDSINRSDHSSSDHESDDEALDEKSSVEKNVRFGSSTALKRVAENQSDFTVTDPDDSDDIMNYGRERLKTREDENRDVIIGGKALRVTKARQKYTEEYSDYEDDYRSVRYQPRLRERRPINYSKQLMPANFTQILEHESKLLDGIIDATERFKEEGKSRREGLSTKKHRSGFSATYTKSPRRHERLNESDDEEPPTLKNGRIFGLLQASSIGYSKNQILPVNMKDMMQAEEMRLLKKVDTETKDKFLLRKDKADVELNQSISKIGFEDVSGFDGHIMSLKEMVGLPLMYPEIFSKFAIVPPKGVLFHGPPGTGKTMMARALANSCSTAGRPVAFFMRKGADILSKWVGESERQLRLLFEQAKAWQPSIIFFDEIDGLAPIRSSKQDQIHASVVSTLLSLMDGLDNRGQVVVIGATNRIDSIDPALRRPGRFDREFFFGLPKESARRKIIQLATKDWSPALSNEDLDSLALMTRGYNGADVKALCTEAALHAVRKTFPQIYTGTEKYRLDLNCIHVTLNDFIEIISKLAPSTERSSLSFGRSLPQHIAPLLRNAYLELSSWVKRMIPILKQTQRIKPAPSIEDSPKMEDIAQSTPLWIQDYLKSFAPMLLIYGPSFMGQDLLTSALVEILEQNGFYVRAIDIGSLIAADTSIESILLTAFCELKRHKQAALYLPNLHSWWNTVSDATKEIFLNLLEQIRHASLMVLINAEWNHSDIPDEVSTFFPILEKNSCSRKLGDWRYAYYLTAPNESCRESFFTNLLNDFIRHESPINADPNYIDSALPLVVDECAESDDPLFDADQLHDLMKEYEIHKRKFRQVFAAILEELRKSYRTFTKVLDNSVFPDYQPIEHMDLMIMEDRVHANNYDLPQDFMKDIDLICSNVLQGSNARIPSHRDTIAKVRKLVDSAQEHIQLLTSEFLQQCWYFFLFKRSGVFPSRDLKAKDKEGDNHCDTISVTSEKDPLLALDTVTEEENSTVKADLDESSSFEPIAQDIMENGISNVFNPHPISITNRDAFDEPMQPHSISLDDIPPAQISTLKQSSSFLHISDELTDDAKKDFVKYATLKTDGYALFELEDLAVSLAASCLNNGKVDLESMRRILNQ